MKNIFEMIAEMRAGMKAIGASPEEIKQASNEVTSTESYEEAVKVISKYWK